MTTTPRPVVVTTRNLKPHFDNPPEAWSYTGAPGMMIIDANDEDQWTAYVWSYIADSTDGRAEVEADTIPERAFGYDIGYYPINVDTWEMIPDGPYCAACINPHEYDNPNPRADGQYPQAYHAEMMDAPDEDDDGNPIPRVCIGCGNELYAEEEEEEERAPHFHVVAFISGCLNDYDSGPYDTIEAARDALNWYVQDGGQQPRIPIVAAGKDRYVQGSYIIKIDTCEQDCDPDADY